MMKQVINWTFGGFFRTIGRTLAFIVIGIAIAYIFSISNIKIPNIFRFSLMQVNASTFQPLGTNFYYNGSSTAIPYVNNYDMYYIDFEPATSSIHYFSMVSGALVNPTGGVSIPTGATYVNFKGLIKQDSTRFSDIECVNYQGTGDHEYCDQWDFNNNYTFSLELGQYDNTGGYTISSCSLSIPYFGTYNSNNGISFTARCPIYQNTRSLQYVRFSFNNYPVNFDLGLGLYMQNVEINDTQSIVQQQQETNNQINNTNTTQESNETANFFTSYQDNTPTALTSVVSAPLDIFNKLLTGVSSPLCFTLKSKQVCIPNGVMIWNKSSRTSFQIGNKFVTPHPFNNDTSLNLSPLVQLFNLVAGGYLCYKMLISLFRIVEENILNPTNSRVEVMKL